MGTEEQYGKLIDTIIWLKKILASLEKKRKEFKFDWQSLEDKGNGNSNTM